MVRIGAGEPNKGQSSIILSGKQEFMNSEGFDGVINHLPRPSPSCSNFS